MEENMDLVLRLRLQLRCTATQLKIKVLCFAKKMVRIFLRHDILIHAMDFYLIHLKRGLT